MTMFQKRPLITFATLFNFLLNFSLSTLLKSITDLTIFLSWFQLLFWTNFLFSSKINWKRYNKFPLKRRKRKKKSYKKKHKKILLSRRLIMWWHLLLTCFIEEISNPSLPLHPKQVRFWLESYFWLKTFQSDGLYLEIINWLLTDGASQWIKDLKIIKSWLENSFRLILMIKSQFILKAAQQCSILSSLRDHIVRFSAHNFLNVLKFSKNNWTIWMLKLKVQ